MINVEVSAQCQVPNKYSITVGSILYSFTGISRIRTNMKKQIKNKKKMCTLTLLGGKIGMTNITHGIHSRF